MKQKAIPLEIITTKDGSHTLYNPSLDETYHSRHGAITESRHVFIDKGLKSLHKVSGPIRILEIGLGTGLNVFLTSLEAEKILQEIYYTVLEVFPLPENIIRKLNYPDILGKRSEFDSIHLAVWESPVPINPYFYVFKHHMSAEDYSPAPETYHLIFFDAFAPGKQPDIWAREILGKMYSALVSGGSLITYCAQGQFKRDLAACGFSVETLEGPPGKKEMVRGIKQ